MSARRPRFRRNWSGALLWLVTLPSLVVCLALTVPRFLDSGQPRLVELASLSPLGIPFACAGTAGAAALLTTRAETGNHAARWALLGGASMLAIHLAWLAPFYAGSAPRPGSGAQFVILAQNFEYGDPSALARAATSHAADVVILTDIPPSQLAALRGTDIASEYPFQVGIGEHGPEGSVVLSKHTLSDEIAISDGADSRLVRIVIPGVGPVDVVAAHPTPPYQGDAWRRDHDRIAAFLRDRYASQTRVPAIIAGDFNATTDNAPFRRLLDLGFEDAVDRINGGYQPTWPGGGSRRFLGLPIPPLVQIDHVLVSQALGVSRVDTIQVSGSDHRAVVVRIARK